MKFPLGQTLVTPGVIVELEGEQECVEFLKRHAEGDWGIVDEEDWAANDNALKDGSRLLSAYVSKNGTKVWVITEADRSATTILLPDEY